MATKSRSKWFRKHLLRHNPIYYFQSATSLGQTPSYNCRLAYSGLKDKLAWQIHRSPDVSSHCLSVFLRLHCTDRETFWFHWRNNSPVSNMILWIFPIGYLLGSIQRFLPAAAWETLLSPKWKYLNSHYFWNWCDVNPNQITKPKGSG